MYRESVLSTQMCLWNNKDLKVAAGLGRLQNPALQRTLGSSLWIHPGWENIIKGWRHQDLSVLTAPDLGSTLNLTRQSRNINRVVPCFSVQKVKSQRDKQRTCSAQEIIQALGAAGLEEKRWPSLISHSRVFLPGQKSQKLHSKPPGKVGCFPPSVLSHCSHLEHHFSSTESHSTAWERRFYNWKSTRLHTKITLTTVGLQDFV